MAGTMAPAHLLLAEERHRVAHLAQHGAHFGVVCRHHAAHHAAAHFKLRQQALLLLALSAAGLWGLGCVGRGGSHAAELGGWPG